MVRPPFASISPSAKLTYSIYDQGADLDSSDLLAISSTYPMLVKAHQMKFRRRGGGYYLNAGCSELIINGSIRLIQSNDIEHFIEDGVLLKSGELVRADVTIAATGYHTQQELVRRLLGDTVANRI